VQGHRPGVPKSATGKLPPGPTVLSCRIHRKGYQVIRKNIKWILIDAWIVVISVAFIIMRLASSSALRHRLGF
jgi:hypothetical protein